MENSKKRKNDELINDATKKQRVQRRNEEGVPMCIAQLDTLLQELNTSRSQIKGQNQESEELHCGIFFEAIDKLYHQSRISFYEFKEHFVDWVFIFFLIFAIFFLYFLTFCYTFYIFSYSLIFCYTFINFRMVLGSLLLPKTTLFHLLLLIHFIFQMKQMLPTEVKYFQSHWLKRSLKLKMSLESKYIPAIVMEIQY